MYNSNQALTLDQVRTLAPSVFQSIPSPSMSSRYSQIATVDVLQSLMQAGFQPFKASQSHVRLADRKEYAKHMIRLRQTGGLQRIGDVFPEVVLINSHDGSSSYKLMGGLFRLVCSNGLIVADSLLASQKIRHTGNVIEEVTSGALQIVSEMPKTIDAVERWRQIQLNAAEQTIMAEAAHTVRFADAEGKVTTPLTANRLLQVRRYGDDNADLWTTFNHIQENVIRGGQQAYDRSNGRARSVTSRAVKGIDQDVRLNRALWTIAERMAELKTN